MRVCNTYSKTCHSLLVSKLSSETFLVPPCLNINGKRNCNIYIGKWLYCEIVIIMMIMMILVVDNDDTGGNSVVILQVMWYLGCLILSGHLKSWLLSAIFIYLFYFITTGIGKEQCVVTVNWPENLPCKVLTKVQ